MLRSTLNRAALGLLFCLIGAMPVQAADVPATDVHWVAAWGAAPVSAGPALQAQTVRQRIRSSIGGSHVRLRLSNLFGTVPLTIGPVHVAKPASGSAIEPGTDRALTFAGKATITIVAGSSVLSDPIAFPLAALEELAVSLYLPDGTREPTIHGFGNQVAYFASGDATAATEFPEGETGNHRYFLTDLEVVADPVARAIVVLGDSITDGVGSAAGQNARWPDVLAARLQADPIYATIAVVNAGVAGNRILNDAAAPYRGPSSLSRFDRDALDKPGVRWILLLQGGNDISGADVLKTPRDQVSARQIIEGMQALITRAHAKGIKIFGATLLPKGGRRFPGTAHAGGRSEAPGGQRMDP